MKIGIIIDMDYKDFNTIMLTVKKILLENKNKNTEITFVLGNETPLQKKIIECMRNKKINVMEFPSENQFKGSFTSVRNIEILALCKKTYLFCNTNKSYFVFITKYANFRNYNCEHVLNKKRG